MASDHELHSQTVITMLKIGVLSDTHGVLPEAYADFFESCDEIWHAGDVGKADVIDQLQKVAPVRVVWGNIDGADVRAASQEELFFQLLNQRIFLRHIVGSPSKYDWKIYERLRELRPDLVIAGHSHILQVKYDPVNKWYFINPGAAGKYGFHLKQTMIRFTLTENGITDLEIWEKDK